MSLPEVEGGGPGLNDTTVAESNKKGFTFPNNGSIGGRAGTSRLFHGVCPAAAVWVARPAQMVAFPTATLALSVLARAINRSATCLPKASPALTSLRAAAPDSMAANSASSAFCWMLAISSGNNDFIISAVTPASTAASEGYAGKLVFVTFASTPESIL